MAGLRTGITRKECASIFHRVAAMREAAGDIAGAKRAANSMLTLHSADDVAGRGMVRYG